jgi:hypothetical protein
MPSELDKVTGVALTMQGRSAGISVERQDAALFPFEAFSFDNPNETLSPVLSLSEPWVLDVGEISTSQITNFGEDVRTEAETEFLQQQITDLETLVDDGYTSWFYEGVPTLSNEPAVNWTDDPTKQNHVGDTYYDMTSGTTYKFLFLDPGYGWEEFFDSGVTAALEAAAAAQDTADGKRRVFTIEPTPPYDVGDLWSRGDGNIDGGVWVATVTQGSGGSYNIADWSKTTDATNDTSLTTFVTDTYEVFVESVEASFQETLNGRDFLSYHLEQVAKEVKNIDADHQFSMSQITVGQGQIDIRVGAVEEGTQDLSEAFIILDARVGASEIQIGTNVTGISDNGDDIFINTQGLITVNSDLTQSNINIGTNTTGVGTNSQGLIDVNSDLTSSNILIQTNLDVGTNHSTAFINLGIDPNGSSVDIEADKITLDGTINLDDTLSVSGGVVQIIGNLSVGTTTDNGNFEVKANGTVKCTNIEAVGGTFTGELIGVDGTFSGDITGASGEFNGTVKVTSGVALAEYTSGSILFNVLGDVSTIEPSLSGGNWGLKLSSGNSVTEISEDLLVRGASFTSGHVRMNTGHQLIRKNSSAWSQNGHIYATIASLLPVGSTKQLACWIEHSSGRRLASVFGRVSSDTVTITNYDGVFFYEFESPTSTNYRHLWI